MAEDIRRNLITKHRERKGAKMIAKMLHMPVPMVKSIIMKWKKTRTVSTLARSGRPQKMSERLSRKLVREATIKPGVTLNDLKDFAAEAGTEVHKSTISRALHKTGLYGRVARKKPLLKKNHLKARLEFANRHLNESPEFWKHILWSDETKIELFGLNTKKYVWRKTGSANDPANTIPTVKHGGGCIMLWGCFAAGGTGSLVKIDGLMDSKKYIEILEENVRSSTSKRKLGRHFQYQHDNDPKHCIKIAKEWF